MSSDLFQEKAFRRIGTTGEWLIKDKVIKILIIQFF